MPELALFADDAFRADPWTRLDDAAPVPDGGQVVLTAAQWQRHRDRERHSNRPLGLALEADAPLDVLADDLPRFSLIALPFPKFSDGRAYSTAHRLRHDHGFKGELRATGDVLFDQIQLMARCGFDSFEIRDAATRRLLESGRRSGLNLFTQPSIRPEAPGGGLAWRRRI